MDFEFCDESERGMSLEDDIRKKELKNIYLLYGREAYLRRNYKKFLLKIWFPDGTDSNMNYSHYEGAGTDFDDVLHQADTMPFFAEYRVIVIENSGIFSAAGKENIKSKLNDFLLNMPDTVRFLFIEDEAKKTSKLFKTIEKIGLCEEVNTFHGSRYEKWILSRIKNEGLSIKEDAYREFFLRTSSDMKTPDLMQSVDLELNKLISYCHDKGTIEKADVEEIVTGQTNTKIYSLMDAIFEKDKEKSLEIYNDLVMAKEAPAAIISTIEKQLINLLSLSSKMKNGENIESTWQNRKNMSVVRKLGVEEITRLLDTGVTYDDGIKSGKYNPDVAMTLFLSEVLT